MDNNLHPNKLILTLNITPEVTDFLRRLQRGKQGSLFPTETVNENYPSVEQFTIRNSKFKNCVGIQNLTRQVMEKLKI